MTFTALLLMFVGQLGMRNFRFSDPRREDYLFVDHQANRADVRHHAGGGADVLQHPRVHRPDAGLCEPGVYLYKMVGRACRRG